MMASSKAQSYGASIIPNTLARSMLPSGKFCSSSISSSYPAFASTMSTVSSPIKSSSPKRINADRWGSPLVSIHRGCVSTSSRPVQFSIDRRNSSPVPSVASLSSRERNQNENHSITSLSSRERNQNGNHGNSNKEIICEKKKTCMCSPTTHPGSFRCKLHKNVSNGNRKNSNSTESWYQWHRWYARRSALKNSFVKIGTVEGDLMKRALASLTRPSSNHQRRRCDFQSRPSRLSVMSKAGD